MSTKKFLIEFNTQESIIIDAFGLSDAYWTAKTYENSTRVIFDIGVV